MTSKPPSSGIVGTLIAVAVFLAFMLAVDALVRPDGDKFDSVECLEDHEKHPDIPATPECEKLIHRHNY